MADLDNEISMPVHIHLTSTITQQGQSQSMHFDELGELITRGGSHYLRYTEHQGQSEALVTMKLNSAETHLRRKGTRSSHFVFNPNLPTDTTYSTEYGDIPMRVTTDMLEAVVDEIARSGHLMVDYHLHAAGQEVGSYQLRLQFNA